MSTPSSQSRTSRDACTRRRFVQVAVAGVLIGPPAGLGQALARPLFRDPGDDGSAFLAAAERGDLETVTRLLAARPGLLEVVDDHGRSAFAIAHLRGHAAIGAHLTEGGYQPDVHEAALALDWGLFTALTEADTAAVHRAHPIGGNAMYCAAVGGAGSSIWRVYSATASPNPVAPEGSCAPLQAALRFHDLRAAELTAATLLANSADANPPQGSESPPLHIAAERGSVELVEMLIRRGADVSAKDADGRSAAQAAAAARQAAVVALLARQAEIPRTHSTSRTAFDQAGARYVPPSTDEISVFERERFVGASHGNLEYVKEAAERDPRLVHSVATTGEICVEACAHTGRRAVVDYLLERGAPYSLPTAVMRSDLERVKALLDEDPLRIHERGAHDFALLWYPVIGRCDIEMMELLLARGAKVEEQHFLGTTALHWACRRGMLDVVELLVEHGADVNRVGRKFGGASESPLQCADSGDHTKIVSLLRARGARG